MREEILLRLSEIVFDKIEVFIFFLQFHLRVDPSFEADLVLEFFSPLFSQRLIVEAHGVSEFLINLLS